MRRHLMRLNRGRHSSPLARRVQTAESVGTAPTNEPSGDAPASPTQTMPSIPGWDSPSPAMPPSPTSPVARRVVKHKQRSARRPRTASARRRRKRRALRPHPGRRPVTATPRTASRAGRGGSPQRARPPSSKHHPPPHARRPHTATPRTPRGKGAPTRPHTVQATRRRRAQERDKLAVDRMRPRSAFAKTIDLDTRTSHMPSSSKHKVSTPSRPRTPSMSSAVRTAPQQKQRARVSASPPPVLSLRLRSGSMPDSSTSATTARRPHSARAAVPMWQPSTPYDDANREWQTPSPVGMDGAQPAADKATATGGHAPVFSTPQGVVTTSATGEASDRVNTAGRGNGATSVDLTNAFAVLKSDKPVSLGDPSGSQPHAPHPPPTGSTKTRDTPSRRQRQLRSPSMLTGSQPASGSTAEEDIARRTARSPRTPLRPQASFRSTASGRSNTVVEGKARREAVSTVADPADTSIMGAIKMLLAAENKKARKPKPKRRVFHHHLQRMPIGELRPAAVTVVTTRDLPREQVGRKRRASVATLLSSRTQPQSMRNMLAAARTSSPNRRRGANTSPRHRRRRSSLISGSNQAPHAPRVQTTLVFNVCDARSAVFVQHASGKEMDSLRQGIEKEVANATSHRLKSAKAQAQHREFYDIDT